MAVSVQTFSCSRCDGGEFRAIPDDEGMAPCPWCGDPVGAGKAPPEEKPQPKPQPQPAKSPELPVAEILERLVGPLKKRLENTEASDPEKIVKDATRTIDVLRERNTEQLRLLEKLEVEVSAQSEKKQELKKAVGDEFKEMGKKLGETRIRLSEKEEEGQKLQDDLDRLEESFREKNEGLQSLQDTLKDREDNLRQLEEAREEAQKETKVLRSTLGSTRQSADKAIEDLQLRLIESEKRVQDVLQNNTRAETDLKALRAKITVYQKKVANDRRIREVKLKSLEEEIGAKDRKIEELQMLVKALGERLNAVMDRTRPGPAP